MFSEDSEESSEGASLVAANRHKNGVADGNKPLRPSPLVVADAMAEQKNDGNVVNSGVSSPMSISRDETPIIVEQHENRSFPRPSKIPQQCRGNGGFDSAKIPRIRTSISIDGGTLTPQWHTPRMPRPSGGDASMTALRNDASSTTEEDTFSMTSSTGSANVVGKWWFGKSTK